MANGVKHRTMIGGQAVIEGVMMRGVRNSSLSVRKPDGTIETEIWENSSLKDRSLFFRFPIIRGVVSFVEMLVYGYRTMMKSVEVAGVEDEPSEFDKKIGEKFGEKGTRGIMGLSAFLGFALAVALFIVLPAFTVKTVLTAPALQPFRSLIEGLLRIAVFLAYLILISRMKDIQRVFEYHGAEHKTIYCYEHEEEMTVRNARKYGRLHPRCGTSFLLIVLIVSILVFSFVTWDNVALRIALHILLLPLVVGISYEIIKFAGRHDNSVMRFLLAPGLWLQKLTTREPDDSQLEVAIRALDAVLTGNREDDSW